MPSDTAADQLEMAGSVDTTDMSTVELESILVNKTGHRVFSSPFTNCYHMASVHAGQLPHQDRIPHSLLEVTSGPCCLLCSAQTLLGGVCVE